MTDIVIDFSLAVERAEYRVGDYVLYRNPALYWTGQSGHTFVCQVVFDEVTNRLGDRYRSLIALRALATGALLTFVPTRYVRLLPAADCMRDIDAAPLSSETSGLHPAAVAWLEQNAVSAAVDGGAA